MSAPARYTVATRQPRDLSWYVLAAGVTSITWMGFRISANNTVSDVLLILSLAIAGPSVILRSILRIPSVVVLPIFVLMLLELYGLRTQSSRFMGVRMSIAILLCVVATERFAKHPTERRSLTHLYVYGAAVSGVVAIVSRATGRYIRPPGVPVFPSREVGLTLHPNHLALTCVLALAAATFSEVAAERPLLRFGLITSLVGSLFVAGSRACLLGAFVIGAIAVWRSVSRYRAELVAGSLFVGAIALILGDGLLSRFSAVDRFFSLSSRATENVAASDAERLSYAQQSFGLFTRSPIIGSGLDQLRYAHSLYLQILTCGGIVLLLALLPMFLKALRVGRLSETRRVDPNAASILAWLISAVFMNAVFDRYLYLLFALALAGPYWTSSAEHLNSPAQPRRVDREIRALSPSGRRFA